MPTVFFICYGNICRSPFAEHYARSRAIPEEISRWRFGSAGVGAILGTSSPAPAVQAASRLGVDLRPHRATPVRDLLVRSDDLLVAMDRLVFGTLAVNLGKTLAEVTGPGDAPLRLLMQELNLQRGPSSLDVPDPMGLDVGAYLSSYGIIADAVDRLLVRLGLAR